MSDAKLGQLISRDTQRDAIHIAIAPVEAGPLVKLYPGDHVGLDENGMATHSGPHIGIVDPFLTKPVLPEQWFYLCLYQQTVTGMRHHWSHPSFAAPIQQTPDNAVKLASEAWCRAYAREIGVDYNDLMLGAANWINSGDYLVRGDQLEGVWTSAEFWKHYAAITGKVGEGNFFSCSC